MLYAREYLFTNDLDNSLKEFLYTLQMPEIDLPHKKLVLLYCLLQVAIIYEALKNFDEALWYCQEFIKEDYTYREPYIIMAEIYSSMKMPTLAEGCIKAAEQYCNQKFNWIERANTWNEWLPDVASTISFDLNKVDDAINYVKEALKHDPDNSRLLKNYIVFLEAKLSK